MRTVHQFPVQRNQPPAAPEEVADALGVAIDAAVGADASFEAREAAALALTNEATRLFLERELLAIADGHGTHVEVDGVIYQRHEPGIVRYFTLCGAVDIERWTDREMGVRNGPTPDAGPSGLRRGPGGADDPGARLPDCPGLREGAHAQLRGGYDGRPPMSALAQHAGTGGQGHRDRGHAGGASHRTAPAAGGAGAGRRRRHLTGPRPHVGAHGGGRPGRRDARGAAQDAADALHTHEASPGECHLPDGLCRHDQLPRRRRTGAGHAPLHRCSARVPYGPSRATDDGRSSPCAPAGARPGRRGSSRTARPSCGISCARPSWPNRWSRPATKRSTGIISPSGSPTSYGTGSPTRPLAGRGCLGGTRASTALTTPSIASAHGSVTATPTPSPGATAGCSSSERRT